MNHDITATQQAVLAYAHEHHHGQVLWFPDTVKGGARTKIVESLTTRGFIAQTEQGLTLTDAGYAALGITPPAAQTAQPKAPREHSKQAQVIAMLQRPEGATIEQICQATGWQQHTVRGTFAGAFKKRGLSISSSKNAGAQRVYRLAVGLHD
jgi:uncharacterized protein